MLEKIDNESLVVVVLAGIVIVSMITMGVHAKDIVIAVSAGLIGYLRGKASKGGE